MFGWNKDKFLIFHLASRNSLELKRFVSRSKNKDKARRELIKLKYNLSKLSPLLFRVVKMHSEMINTNFMSLESGYFRVDDADLSSSFAEVFIFKCGNFRLSSMRKSREFKNGPRFYVFSHENRHGSTSIKTSYLEEKVMKNLIAFNCENKKALDNFKKMKHESDIRNLVDV